MKKTIKKIMLLILMMLLAGVLFAERIGGVNVPDTMRVGGKNLTLNGGGMRLKVIIKVYVGGLYLQNPSSDEKEIIEADEPMAIWMKFVRDVDNKSITDAWSQGFQNSADDGYGASQSKIDAFNGVFSSDVKKNGIYEVVYVPGEGIQMKIDGKEKAVIPGLDFKQAVFAIWLGSVPADEKLKEGMLGG
jgi:hypothetical protein